MGALAAILASEVAKVHEPAADEVYRTVWNHPYRARARTDRDQAQMEHEQARMELMARLGMDPSEEVRARVQWYTVSKQGGPRD